MSNTVKLASNVRIDCDSGVPYKEVRKQQATEFGIKLAERILEGEDFIVSDIRLTTVESHCVYHWYDEITLSAKVGSASETTNRIAWLEKELELANNTAIIYAEANRKLKAYNHKLECELCTIKKAIGVLKEACE